MTRKHFFEKVSIPLGLVLFAALIFGSMRYGKEPLPQQPHQQLPGIMSSQVHPVTQNLSNDYAEVIIEYPQFTDAALNTFIKEKFVTSFLQNADENKKLNEDSFKARQETDPASGHTLPSEDERGYYHVSFKLLPVSDPSLVSLIFFEEGYSGGAHPYHASRSMIYDMTRHTVVSFDEVLHSLGMTFEELQASVRGRLVAQLNDQLRAEDPQATVPHDVDTNLLTMIQEGTQTPDDFQNVTFENNSVVFHFQEYQVAPYVYGPQDVDFPRVKVQGAL